MNLCIINGVAGKKGERNEDKKNEYCLHTDIP